MSGRTGEQADQGPSYSDQAPYDIITQNGGTAQANASATSFHATCPPPHVGKSGFGLSDLIRPYKVIINLQACKLLGKSRLRQQNPCLPQHFCEIFKEFTMLFICFYPWLQTHM